MTLIWNGVLAFFAGVLLNFTPCVLPVIPIKIQAILREVHSSPKNRILASLSLLAGSVLFFLVLGILTASLGILWGELFQSQIFLVTLSLILLISAIATFREWTFNLPQILYKVPFHNYLGAFFTGALAGVLSTPCAGPFLGAVLAYALTQTAGVILVLFFFIGFGLAFPYVLILLFPGFLSPLLRMKVLVPEIKPLLSFVLLGGAIFFAQVLIPTNIHDTLWVLYGIGIFLWALVTVGRTRGVVGRVLPVLSIIGVLYGLDALLRTPSENGLSWKPYSEQNIAAAYSDSRPVLIEFTADWCINCKVLEKTTYANPEVIDKAKAANLIALREIGRAHV